MAKKINVQRDLVSRGDISNKIIPVSEEKNEVEENNSIKLSIEFDNDKGEVIQESTDNQTSEQTITKKKERKTKGDS